MIKRIGFACKWIDTADQVNGIGTKDDAKKYNTGATTVAWLNRQTKEVAEQKLWDLMVQNIESTRRLVERVGNLDENLRMVRLSSDILPCYTESTWGSYWRQPDVQRFCESGFAEIGRLARSTNTRLSFHPGQFTVLASDRPDVVEKSIEEFEYHASMARWMGYGQTFQDFKINVHIAGRLGPAGIRTVYPRLSPEARNTITIENEEIGYGLNECLTLSDILPIVMDIHHHWIKSGGEYISPTDHRVQLVVESWRGIRPAMHYSLSREDILVNHNTTISPHYESLITEGFNRQKLRAHSDFYWNQESNRWALSFLDQFDIMCESKAKNLASRQLYEQWLSTQIKSQITA